MKNIWLIFFLAFFYNSIVLSQALSQLEANYAGLQSTLSEERCKLDSLKRILDMRAKEIDAEKSKSNYNKEAVTGLMAGSISISNQIDALQKKILNLETEDENLKKELSRRYSVIIDSLQLLLKKENPAEKKIDEIKRKIYSTTEKKMLVSPKVSLLSFYPEKIIGIDLNRISDKSQKRIYREYLTKALSEVNDRLKNLDENIIEVENIITLQKKTKSFLEETEFETNIPGQASTGIMTDQTPEVDTYTASPNVSVKASIFNQVQGYSLLLSQLQQPLGMQRVPDISKIKIAGSQKGKGGRVITYQQYLRLLKETKTSLLEYRLILVHKIGQGK